MYIALGALAAAFLALLMVPAVGARAERLARRRMEALLPRSLSELNAERDHLRAELALRERRLEQRVEAVLAGRQVDRAELGRRALRIDDLETALAAREARIAALETDLAETRETLSATQADLLDTRGDLADTREALAALRKAHLELGERHDAAMQEIDAKRIAISDLETRLATQTQRADELERHLGRTREALAEERALVAQTRKALADEQARGEVLDRRFAEARTRAESRAAAAEEAQARARALDEQRAEEARRADAVEAALAAAETQAAGLTRRLEELAARDATLAVTHASALQALEERIEILKAERSALEGALATAREGRQRVEREIADLRRAGPGPTKAKDVVEPGGELEAGAGSPLGNGGEEPGGAVDTRAEPLAAKPLASAAPPAHESEAARRL